MERKRHWSGFCKGETDSGHVETVALLSSDIRVRELAFLHFVLSTEVRALFKPPYLDPLEGGKCYPRQLECFLARACEHTHTHTRACPRTWIFLQTIFMLYLHTRKNTNTREAKCLSVCSFDQETGGCVLAETLASLNICRYFVSSGYCLQKSQTIKCPIVCWIFDSILLYRKKAPEILSISQPRVSSAYIFKTRLRLNETIRTGSKKLVMEFSLIQGNSNFPRVSHRTESIAPCSPFWHLHLNANALSLSHLCRGPSPSFKFSHYCLNISPSFDTTTNLYICAFHRLTISQERDWKRRVKFF